MSQGGFGEFYFVYVQLNEECFTKVKLPCVFFIFKMESGRFGKCDTAAAFG